MVKIERKRGLNKMRISHNKKLFWAIVLLLIILAILIFFIIRNKPVNSNNIEKECYEDKDCAPVCGCHPDSCVPAAKKGECERLICTQECSGPLDCNAGYCSCVNNKCSVVNTK